MDIAKSDCGYFRGRPKNARRDRREDIYFILIPS